MYPDRLQTIRQKLTEEIQELEDAYAEALSDNTDARTLSVVWNRIKTLTCELDKVEQSTGNVLTHR